MISKLPPSGLGGRFFLDRVERLNRESFDFRAFFHAVWRRRTELVLWLLVCAAIAGAYVAVTPPEFTAYTQVILETPKRPRLLLDADGEALPMDSAQADSRLEVIKSERLLRFVYDTLNSQRDGGGRGHMELSAKADSDGNGDISSDEIDTAAFLKFMDHVSARRIGLSYVVEISFRAKTPNEAAHVVNSITSAYLRDLLLSASTDSEVMQRRILTASQDAEILLAAVKAGTIPNTQIAGIDARVISAAIEPLRKSSPHTLLTIALALFIGLSTGVGAIFFANNRDRTIRSIKAARRMFGPDLSGIVIGGADDGNTNGGLGLTITRPGRSRLLKYGVSSWQSSTARSEVCCYVAEALRSKGKATIVVPRSRPDHPSTDLQGSTGCEAGEIGADRACEGQRRPRPSGNIVVDLPPLEDAAAIPLLDRSLHGVFLIVEQKVTTIDDLASALSILEAKSVPFLGFILYVAPPLRSAGGFREAASGAGTRTEDGRSKLSPRLGFGG